MTDGGACIGNLQDSVRWMSSAAGCIVSKTYARAGRDPDAHLGLHTNCTRVGRDFQIAFFKLNSMGHKIPSVFWFDAALGFWTHSRGPGEQDAKNQRQRTTRQGHRPP